VRVWVAEEGEDDLEWFGQNQTFLEVEIGRHVVLIDFELGDDATESLGGNNEIVDAFAVGST